MTHASHVLPTPYYDAPGFTLYHSDCLEVLRALPDDSVDLVFSDPPYFMDRAEWDRSRSVKEEYDFHRAWLAECARILTKSGNLWVSNMRRGIHQCALAMEDVGLVSRHTVVWYKPNLRTTRSRSRLVSNHELLLHAVRHDAERPFFNQEILRLWRKNYSLETPCSQCGGTTHVHPFHITGEPMGNVWAIPTTSRLEKRHGFHPTQKPYDLLLRIVYATSRKGDMVLDPFCGTGTSGIAAVRNGRRFIGVDFTQDYLDIAVKRFQEVQTSLVDRERKVDKGEAGGRS